MNRNHKFSAILFIGLFLIGLSAAVRAQDNNTNYAFVVFETTVTKKGVETSDKNPAERRFYISNIVEFPNNSMSDRSIFRNAYKVADEYFIANVVKPLETKGFSHQYYDDGITVNNKASYLETRADVEEVRKQVLENLKGQNANVFTFNWTRTNDAKGLETSLPTLLYRGSEQPLYGTSEPKTNTPTKTNIKPLTKKTTNKN